MYKMHLKQRKLPKMKNKTFYFIYYHKLNNIWYLWFITNKDVKKYTLPKIDLAV